MTDKEIARINELAKKQRSPEGLTDEEKAEQKALRVAYINAYKRSLESQLENLTIVNPDGSKTKITKKQ